MQKSEIKERLERNFYRTKVAPRSTIVREWEKLESTQLFDLLQNSNRLAHPQAKDVLIQMATRKWTLLATAHDIGSNKHNDPLHITIRIGNSKAIHLYCREIPGPGLQITRITKR